MFLVIIDVCLISHYLPNQIPVVSRACADGFSLRSPPEPQGGVKASLHYGTSFSLSMYKILDPQPDFPKLEEEILEFWEQNKTFEKSLEKTKDGEPYTFYDGPPFATGLPHYGHILASTIKDVIPRYQTMKGRFVRRRWGWDCHGLPIEEIVERHLKISGKKQIEELGIEKFNETCRSMVLTYVAEWRKMIRRIARWVDFDNSYKTMDRDYMESVWWAFKEIYDKDLVYEGRKVLLYCPRCETPVSNFEVAMDNSYKEVTEESVTVKFKVRDQDNTYLLAWTTTPWTLPGNVALAVGGDIDYVKVSYVEFDSVFVPTDVKKMGTQNVPRKHIQYYILAKDRIDEVFKSRGSRVSKPTIIGEFKGKDLIGLAYDPLFEVAGISDNPKAHKVYAADFVNTEEGTGIVHTAVVYGEDDYQLGLKERLPVIPLLDEKGEFNEKAPKELQGQYFKKSEKFIKDNLEARGLLLQRKMHKHSYPHCWRCENELFYNAIPAWFINVQKIKKDLLKTNTKQIDWYPEHLKTGRYQKSVEAAPDWNISRNRYWGNAIPVWKCEACKENTVVGSLAELKEKAVSGYSDELDLHRPYIDKVVLKCDKCGGESHRITEIFDSWVEAGSMPFAEYHYPFEQKEIFESRFPAQFVAEYIAQTRAWFYVMHVISQILFKKAPFENIVTTGTILAEDGSKMSKSKANFPDPWKIINEYGVDTLRFYLMNSVVMQADNLNFSEKDLAIIHRKVIRILWNVYNYFVTYANAKSWVYEDDKSPNDAKNSPNVLDQWINTRLQEVINKTTDFLDKYDTVKATRELQRYIDDLSTWYLRRSRGREDNHFFATLFRNLIWFVRLLAPVMPFLADEIYRNLNSGDKNYPESVHLTDWPKSRKLSNEETRLLSEMEEVRAAAELGNSIRKQKGIKLRQPLAAVIVEKKGNDKISWSEELKQVLLDELNVKKIEQSGDMAWNEDGGLKLGLDLAVNPELQKEGDLRELERAVQALRKEAGLKVGEPAKLFYKGADNLVAKLDKARLSISELASLRQETITTSLEVTISSGDVWLGLAKA